MIFPLDVGIKNLLSSISSLKVDIANPAKSDIIIASNSWAFRERVRQMGSVQLPFINYRIKPAGIHKVTKLNFPKNYDLSMIGLYDSELKDRVTVKSFTASYEATFWANKYTSTMWVFQEFFKQQFQDNTVNYDVSFKGLSGTITKTFQAPISFINLELDPQWEAAAELDKGNIHSIDLSFEVEAFLFEGQGVVPVDTIILELFYNNGVAPDATFYAYPTGTVIKTGE